ncbi:MAG: hypothetical protein JNL11_19350 [Bdellovibrionaceae bacterium]|nr:hypothetical protein [Pseudobdellovibrionaceae bacterium]
MRYIVVLSFLVFLIFHKVNAEPIQSNVGHLYWGLGPNFGLLGNVRVGFSNVEIGVIQNTGFGIAYVRRTSTPLFVQIGAVSTSAGGGIIGGGGMEWNTSSWFRWRTDITVSTDKGYQTEGFVSFGGVFIL